MVLSFKLLDANIQIIYQCVNTSMYNTEGFREEFTSYFFKYSSSFPLLISALDKRSR